MRSLHGPAYWHTSLRRSIPEFHHHHLQWQLSLLGPQYRIPSPQVALLGTPWHLLGAPWHFSVLMVQYPDLMTNHPVSGQSTISNRRTKELFPGNGAPTNPNVLLVHGLSKYDIDNHPGEQHQQDCTSISMLTAETRVLRSIVVCGPRSTAVKIMKIATKYRIPVVPYGCDRMA